MRSCALATIAAARMMLSDAVLQGVGFWPADWVPAGTAYSHGRLYVCLHGRQTVRLFVPAGDDEVEISTGTLFAPVVQFQGRLYDADQLQRVLANLLA